jgi:hypothetical protein
MNSSYNYSDFTGLPMESSQDSRDCYEAESLQLTETTYTEETGATIESYLFASGYDRYIE